jgi:hypothetical protein
MALVGMLSTQLLHQQLIAKAPQTAQAKFETVHEVTT